MMWQHRVLVRLFIASLFAVMAVHVTMVAVGNDFVGVAAGCVGFLVGDYLAWGALT